MVTPPLVSSSNWLFDPTEKLPIVPMTLPVLTPPARLRSPPLLPVRVPTVSTLVSAERVMSPEPCTSSVLAMPVRLTVVSKLISPA